MTFVLAALAGCLAGAAATTLVPEVVRGVRRERPGGAAAAAVFALGRRFARLPGVRRLAGPALPGDVTARLAAAGGPPGIGAREWIGLKCCTAAISGVCAALATGPLPGRLYVAVLAAAPLAGFAAPDFWLARTVARRLRAAGAELAPMLDLLQVTVAAGAAPVAALGAVGARFDGPLAAEWRAAATAVAVGTSQDDALETLARRLPAPRIRSFADSMRRARRRGLPLADVLALQAAAARHEERIRLRERAARAGPKMQLVVAFVLVPAVMLIVAAALLAELSAPGVTLDY